MKIFHTFILINKPDFAKDKSIAMIYDLDGGVIIWKHRIWHGDYFIRAAALGNTCYTMSCPRERMKPGMELVKTKGIVLRSVNLGDYDKMLTVLTEELGKISVVAKGAKSLKHGGNSYANVFCYSDFVLYPKKELYTVSQANGQESFFGLSEELERLECAAQMAEFVDYICPADQPAPELLRLTLNSLFALAQLHKPPLQVQVVFYLKALSLLGYEPELFYCSACDKEDGLTHFSAEYGGVLCSDCAAHVPDRKPISADALALLRYIRSCGLKELFKFSAGETVLRQVLGILQDFLEQHLEYQLKKGL